MLNIIFSKGKFIKHVRYSTRQSYQENALNYYGSYK